MKPLKLPRSAVKQIARNMERGKAVEKERREKEVGKKTKWPIEALSDKPKKKIKSEAESDPGGIGTTTKIVMRVTEVRSFYIDEYTTGTRGSKHHHFGKFHTAEDAMLVAKLLKKMRRAGNIQIPCKLELHEIDENNKLKKSKAK